VKDYIDFFPGTPEGFHLRVERTLENLEEVNMKYIHKKCKMIVAIAAILVMVIAASAVAVMQGDLLRTHMNESGGEQLAVRVQDVHVSDAAGGFSFTIDEILLQDEKLYASYNVTVPDDGKVYLFSPTQIKLNGEAVNRDFGVDAEYFVNMFALGGEYGNSVSKIMQMFVPEELVKADNNQFNCKCLFMEAEKPLVKVDQEDYEALFTEENADGNENQLMENADVLYYTDTSADGDVVPSIYMHFYPEVRAVMDDNQYVTAEALESIGIAKRMDMREISITIPDSEAQTLVFNDVAQRIFEMDGYSIEITELNLSHFNMSFAALIRKENGEIGKWSENEPYAQFYFLCNADGSDLGTSEGWSMGGGEVELLDNGERVYRVDGYGHGIYPVDYIDELYLAPGFYDANSVFTGYDMSRAIRLEPIYNPDRPQYEPTVAPPVADDLSN